MTEANFRTREWTTGGWAEAFWAAVFLGGFVVAALLFGTEAGTTDGTELLWSILLLVLLLIGRDLTQFLFMRVFGARPSFHWRWKNRSAFGSFWTDDDHSFTRRQAVVLCLAPFTICVIAGLAFVFLTPVGEYGFFILTAFSCVEARFLWFSIAALRQPAGTRFQERKAGTRLYVPHRQGE